MADGAFADLRRLSDLLVGQVVLRGVQRQRVIAQLVGKLGALAVPLLGRVLKSGDGSSRDAARVALGLLASELHTRPRVITELHALAHGETSDDAKVCALGLLAELGEHGAATFADPRAIQRRSALALATQLEAAHDVANAADLMVRQLADNDVVQMLEVLLEVAPAAALRLGAELGLRLDIEPEQRARIAQVIAGAIAEPTPEPQTRPTHVAVLVDADAKIIVVATAKVNGERRWRRWAVLIGESGLIDDCLHEDAVRDHTLDPTASLVANLCADGYRVASTELDHARTLVATAARRSGRAGAASGGNNTHVLGSSYYVGRDLLDLRDAHIVAASDACSLGSPLARALDELAAGDFTAARLTLETCVPIADAGWISEHAGALGACLLALGDAAAAIGHLERAIAAEPQPLHYWNLAAAQHRLGDARGCQQALRRFLSTSAQAPVLADDPEQAHRIAHAGQMLSELARIARIDRLGRGTRRRRRVSTERRARKKR